MSARTYNQRIPKRSRSGSQFRPAKDRVTVEAPERADRRAEMFALLDSAMGSLDDLEGFYRAVARHPSYSWRNQVLIWAQRGDCGPLAGYHSWRKQGRPVKKGARAVWLLGPRRCLPVFCIADTEGARVSYETELPPSVLADAISSGTIAEGCELVRLALENLDACPACGWDGHSEGGCDQCRYG